MCWTGHFYTTASIDHTVLRYLLLSVSEFVVKNIRKTCYFFSIFLCKNSSLTKAFDSCFFLLKKYLIIVNLSHITLSLNHSIKYVCCWWTSKPEASYCIRWKLYCYSSPSHLTPRDLVLHLLSAFLSFFSFSFFWPLKTTTANLQGLTHSNLSKNTNQVFYELSLLGVR